MGGVYSGQIIRDDVIGALRQYSEHNLYSFDDHVIHVNTTSRELVRNMVRYCITSE